MYSFSDDFHIMLYPPSKSFFEGGQEGGGHGSRTTIKILSKNPSGQSLVGEKWIPRPIYPSRYYPKLNCWSWTSENTYWWFGRLFQITWTCILVRPGPTKKFKVISAWMEMSRNPCLHFEIYVENYFGIHFWSLPEVLINWRGGTKAQPSTIIYRILSSHIT